MLWKLLPAGEGRRRDVIDPTEGDTMDENKKAMYDKSGPRVAENFRKRHFEAYYCSDKETACQKCWN